ncbi:MAG TPA: LysR substrate-binding domain-containing protein [Solirubrobacteraceae bacterium]|jgi:DNA-binding transcriptional LysR family regulator
MLEARELRYFLALAEELHFGRAAQRLSIATPGLSRAVRRVELDLGVELFVRDTHGVRLTGAGEALVDRARDALTSLDEALTLAREAGRRELVGALRVGVNPLLRHRLGPAIFEHFASSCPGVRVSRREELSGPLIEELQARRIDAALAFCPAYEDGLSYEPICDAELVVLLSANHRLARRAAISPAQLHDEPLLLPSAAAAPGLRRRFGELFAAFGFEPRYSPREIDHDERMAAVREGPGVLLTSRFFIETMPTGVELLELDPPLPLSFELVCRDESPAPALARFAEVVRDVGKLDLDSPSDRSSANPVRWRSDGRAR